MIVGGSAVVHIYLLSTTTLEFPDSSRTLSMQSGILITLTVAVSMNRGICPVCDTPHPATIAVVPDNLRFCSVERVAGIMSVLLWKAEKYF